MANVISDFPHRLSMPAHKMILGLSRELCASGLCSTNYLLSILSISLNRVYRPWQERALSSVRCQHCLQSASCFECYESSLCMPQRLSLIQTEADPQKLKVED